MKHLMLTMLTAVILTGCATERHYDFAMGESIQGLNDIQILDPEAAERNDGKIAALTLDGGYGVNLKNKYVKGAEAPAEGKTQVTLNFGN
jgi:UDP-N-acetylglucosamine pyrophosphorylase